MRAFVPQAEDSVVKQVQAEKDSLLAQLRTQMAEMQRQHAAMAAELHSKLQWCAMQLCHTKALHICVQICLEHF